MIGCTIVAERMTSRCGQAVDCPTSSVPRQLLAEKAMICSFFEAVEVGSRNQSGLYKYVRDPVSIQAPVHVGSRMSIAMNLITEIS